MSVLDAVACCRLPPAARPAWSAVRPCRRRCERVKQCTESLADFKSLRCPSCYKLVVIKHQNSSADDFVEIPTSLSPERRHPKPHVCFGAVSACIDDQQPVMQMLNIMVTGHTFNFKTHSSLSRRRRTKSGVCAFGPWSALLAASSTGSRLPATPFAASTSYNCLCQRTSGCQVQDQKACLSYSSSRQSVGCQQHWEAPAGHALHRQHLATAA